MALLIIKEKYGSLILYGKKTWELKNRNTRKKGRISIAYSGTRKKYWKVDIVEAIPLSKELSEHNRNKHCSMSSQEELKSGYNEPYAWGMKIYAFIRKVLLF